MAILVTGGAGYIGSHTCVELLNQDIEVIIIDNFANSNPVVLKRIAKITGKKFKSYHVDLLDKESLNHIFEENEIEAVIHFAGLKAVGESVRIPLHYYKNNISGTITLCEVMQKHNVKNLVFSSSATVYGNTEKIPINEGSNLKPINPYGRSKYMVEEILRDVSFSDPTWSIALLRYFNPVGAHESGLIGEDPSGIPNNLMPYIAQVAVGKRDELQVFGNDYPTHDGTGVRDYIHVVDLAFGHLKALEKIMNATGIEAYNLGAGQGYSVLEMVHAFERVSNQQIPYRFVSRREGDISVSYANPSKAKKELGWAAAKDIDDMCRDTWNWQCKNPNGYSKKLDNKEPKLVRDAAVFFNA